MTSALSLVFLCLTQGILYESISVRIFRFPDIILIDSVHLKNGCSFPASVSHVETYNWPLLEFSSRI